MLDLARHAEVGVATVATGSRAPQHGPASPRGDLHPHRPRPGATQKISVGSGGVMLPNNSPLVIAEHSARSKRSNTGRIDLGVGRRARHGPRTARALLRKLSDSEENSRAHVAELLAYFEPRARGRPCAPPGEGLRVPVCFWVRASTRQLARAARPPFAFAIALPPTTSYPDSKIYGASSARPHISGVLRYGGVNRHRGGLGRRGATLFTSLQQASSICVAEGGELPPPSKVSRGTLTNRAGRKQVTRSATRSSARRRRPARAVGLHRTTRLTTHVDRPNLRPHAPSAHSKLAAKCAKFGRGRGRAIGT